MNFWDITNGITVSYLLLLALFLLGKSILSTQESLNTTNPKSRSTVFLAIFLIVQSTCILNSFLWRFFPVTHKQVPYLFYIADTILYLWGPALYFYISGYTNPGFKLSNKSLFHIIPFAVHGILLTIAFHHYNSDTKSILLEQGLFNHRDEVLFYMAFHLHLFLYILFSGFRVYEFRKKVHQEISVTNKISQNWISFVLLGFLTIWLLDVTFQTIYLLTDYSPYFLLNIIYPLLFILVFIIMLKGLNNSMIFEYQKPLLKRKYSGSNLKNEEKETIYRSIIRVMEEKKLYHNSSLTITDLADELSILPKHLSQVINEYFNMNFFDFINEYRIEEVKQHLSLSTETKITILELLYDAGFNSKSSFNKAFRKSTGVTPTEYRKSALSKLA